ncbi:MAG: phosphate ABC transporter permease family protein, partial [Saccharospirillum sp.]
MQTSTLLLALVVLMVAAYALGRQRSVQLAQPLGGIKRLHSLPNYYGLMAAVWTGLPAFVVFVIWSSLESTVITAAVLGSLPDGQSTLSKGEISLLFSQIRNIGRGAIELQGSPELVQAGELLGTLNA